jgi:hypothetical protein
VSIMASEANTSKTGPDRGGFTVARASTNGSLPVYYTLSGTAQNRIDYVALNGSVVIPVQVYDDSAVEGNEIVTNRQLSKVQDARIKIMKVASKD